MNWQVAEKSSFDTIRQFLVAHECGCVSFSSKFKSLILPIEGADERSVIIMKQDDETERIDAAILVTQHGLFLPVFDEPELYSANREISVLKEMFSRFTDMLHSIMGTRQSVAVLQNLFPIQASDFVDYYLFALRPRDYKIPREPKIEHIQIRQATTRDAEKIFPLQKEYELEEVFLDPSRFNDRFCLANLKQTLKKEIVYIAEADGEIVGKAGTNARGFAFDQIGGVYTVRQMRRKGIGGFLVGTLIENIFGRKQNASLFVKKSNPGAITLYKNLGFEFVDDFRIAYYFNNLGFRRE